MKDITMLKSRGLSTGMYEYQQWLISAWGSHGGRFTRDISLPRIVRMVLSRALGHIHSPDRRKRILIVASWKVQVPAFPWSMFREIVPVMWDVWPATFNDLVRFVKLHHVKTLFCTSSQQAKKLNTTVKGVNAIWLPEAIDVSRYPLGLKLAQRRIDVLEFGRRMQRVHDELINYKFKRSIVHEYPADRLIAIDNEVFKAMLRDAKIIICYPKCDTNPESAGGVETLTLRYWECMCSGALMVGRAPRELIKVCGYNPVIELQGNSAGAIESILENIDAYQGLVDKNRRTVEEKGGWDKRIPILLEGLK